MKIHNPIPLQKDVSTRAREEDAQMHEASKLYERQFLQEMVNAMRKTVQHGSFTEPTMAEKIYQDDLFDKYVDQWSDRGGVGISNMIYDQLKAQVRSLRGETDAKPVGPLPLEQQQPLKLPTPHDLRIETKKQGEGDLGFLFEKSEFDQGAYPVLAPWAGRVTSNFRTDDGRSVIGLDHGGGLTSQIGFLGTAVSGVSEVRAGQVLGAWAPEGRALHWRVKG